MSRQIAQLAAEAVLQALIKTLGRGSRGGSFQNHLHGREHHTWGKVQGLPGSNTKTGYMWQSAGIPFRHLQQRRNPGIDSKILPEIATTGGGVIRFLRALRNQTRNQAQIPGLGFTSAIRTTRPTTRSLQVSFLHTCRALRPSGQLRLPHNFSSVASKVPKSTPCSAGVLSPLPSNLTKLLATLTVAISRTHPVTTSLGLLLGNATWRLQKWVEAGGDPNYLFAHSLASAPSELIRPLPTAGRGISLPHPLRLEVEGVLVRLHVALLQGLFNVWEGGSMILRASYLLFLFLPAFITGPVANRLGGGFRKRWLKLVHRSLERAGPAFIKWGQWAATRPDLFPRDMCAELKKLHSSAPAHDFRVTKRTVERAFGCDLSDIFAEFDPEPLASGSIAQVHRAVLRSTPKDETVDGAPYNTIPLPSAAHDWDMEPLGLPTRAAENDKTSRLTLWRPENTVHRLDAVMHGSRPRSEKDKVVESGEETERERGVKVARAREELRMLKEEEEAWRKMRWLQPLISRSDGEGEERIVAVKVRHPGVREAIHRDFLIMNFFARLSSFVPGLRWLRLEDSVAQFAVFMMAQVDLAREAAQLSRFNYNFRRWRSVSFPRPLYPLVHPEVLVETFEAGQSVSRYVDRHSRPRDGLNAELAELGSGVLLKMILVDNFVHADLHPGNILVKMQRAVIPFRPLWWSNLFGWQRLTPAPVTPHESRAFADKTLVVVPTNEESSEITVEKSGGAQGEQEKKGWWGGSSLQGVLHGTVAHPHIVLLDVGMTAELPPRYRQNMLDFWRAITVRDGCAAAEATLKFTNQQSCPDPEAFIQAVDGAFKAWDKLEDFVPAGECMQELLEQIRRHQVNIDGDVCTVIITTLVLESWQRKLDPDLSFMDTLKSLLFRSELLSTLKFTVDGLFGP